ncbi:radical SAM protein [bacterium]|nr:radical SAM protein [bacterium]
MRIWTIFLVVFRNAELGLRDLFGLKYRPYKLLLELTDYCNSKCKTCFIWKKGEEQKVEIKVSELSTSLKEFGPNLLWISLSGGEVTLYSDFDELAEALSFVCPNLRIITFTTNGLKPEKALECALSLKKRGYDLFITVSMDGDAHTHDFIRGIDGNFDRAQKTYELLKDAGIWCHYGLTVSGHNEAYIKNKIKNDIHKIRAFSYEHSGGIYKTHNQTSYQQISQSISVIQSYYKIKSFGEVVEFIYIVLAKKFFSQNKKRLPVPCDVVASSLHIRPNGDIVPCMYLPALGNISRNKLDQILHSVEARSLRSRAIKGNCNKCWMNCYAPHSIMRHPISAIKAMLTTNS